MSDQEKSASIQRLLDETAIRQLSVNYALATDAVGRGDKAGALALYRRTFTPDATIGAGFDRSSAKQQAVGPDAWVEVVAGVFGGYRATQHLIGTVNVSLAGGDDAAPSNTATMTTYLYATHLFSESKDVYIALGTYHDRVVRHADGWRIADRFLEVTAIHTTQRDRP